MANFPMVFRASSLASSAIDQSWQATTGDAREIACSIPKEFGGPNSGLSPEDLYIQALMNCYIATLKVIAQNSRLPFGAIEANAELVLDRDDAAPTPWMKNAHLKFIATGVADAERFRRMMERVSKQCMVLNSVRTNITFEFEVRN